MIRLEAPEGMAVWQVELDRPLPFPTLSAEEHERAARFRFERDQHRWRVCRSTLRVLLGDALGIAPESVTFTYGPYGKPLCSLPFNVSHSGGLALIVLGAQGIDIEQIRDNIDPESLGRRVFTATEQDAVKTVEDFFAAWTAKEALIKAQGGGFSSPLLQRTVWPILEPDIAKDYTLFRLSPAQGFTAALAWEKKAAR